MSVLTTTIRMEDSQFFARLNAMEARLGALTANFANIATRIATTFAPAVAGIGAVTAATLGMKKAIDEASKMEQLQASFEVLIGSADVAKETLMGLQRFADETVFQMPELAGSAKQLMAFGVGADEVVSNLRMLGDVAAGLNIPLSELVDVYGRNLVQGRLFSRDIYQFQSRGIPIIAELAKQFGVAESAVMGMVEAGQVGSEHMLKAFQSLTSEGGLFAGMLEKIARTFGGRMAALADTINAAFRKFGEPIRDVLKPIIENMIARVKEMTPAIREFGERVARIINGVANAFSSGQFTEVVGTALELGFARAMNAFAGGLETTLAIAGGVLTEMLGDADFWDGMLKTLVGIAGQFGAAILRAFEKPLAYVQAFMEKQHGNGPGTKSDYWIERDARAEAERRLFAEGKFKGLSVSEITGSTGKLGMMIAGDEAGIARQREFLAARKELEAQIAKEMGARSLEERADAILNSGGARFGFSGVGLNASEIAQEGSDMVREGVKLMQKPAGDFLEAAKLIAANYEPAALYDEAKLKELEERLKKAFPPLPVAGAAGDADKARKGKGAGEIMGGGRFDVVADSLAKIGGGGGVAGVSAVLEEARNQTSKLESMDKTLVDVRDILSRGFQGGQRINVVTTSG